MRADLSGRVAVVTGGTKGIGRAIVLKLAACGAQVAFHGRDAEAARQVAAEGERQGPRPHFVAGDLGRYGDMKALMATAVEHFGRLDVLVTNGGSRRPRPVLFDEVPPGELTAYFESRAYPRIYAIHAAFPHMKAQGYGKIIALTTDAGRMPTPSESLVGSAAAAVIFLTRALAREFARWGVRINAISTSLTADTPAYDTYRQARDQGSEAVIVKAFRKIEEKAPFGINRPDDLAELALYLAAKESDQLSGATISVNGGISFPAY